MSAPSVTTPGSGGRDAVFVACNDLHLSDTNPVSRTDSYIDELFGLLDQMARLAHAQQATAILVAGDIFHHKAKVSIPTLVRLVTWCRTLAAAGIDVVTIPGNHDLLHNRYESLESQALGLLYALGAMINVSQPQCPARTYLRGNDAVVHVGGVAFPDAFEIEKWRLANTAMPLFGHANSRRIVLGHCFASPEGGDYFGDPVLAYDDIYTACPADVYVFGHDHRDGGIMKLDRGDPDDPAYFVNLGAIARGSIAHDDINRTICCALIRIGPQVTVQRVKLNAKPAADIFDLTAKAQRDADQQAIEQFVTTLQDTLATLGSGKSVEDHLAVLSLPNEVRTRMMRYIADAEVPV